MRSKALIFVMALLGLGCLGLLLWRSGPRGSAAGPGGAPLADSRGPSAVLSDGAASASEARAEIATLAEPASGAEADDGAVLRGRVTNLQGQSIPGARIEVSYRPADDYNILDLAYAHSETSVGETQTDERGDFRIAVPPDWPMRLKASASSYCSALLNDLFAGADLLIVLEPGTALAGRITRKLDGTPVQGTLVRIF